MASTIAFFIYLLFAPLTSTYYECHQGKLIGKAWRELGESEKVEWNEELQMPSSSFFTTMDIEVSNNDRVELLWQYFTDEHKRGNKWK